MEPTLTKKSAFQCELENLVTAMRLPIFFGQDIYSDGLIAVSVVSVKAVRVPLDMEYKQIARLLLDLNDATDSVSSMMPVPAQYAMRG